MHEEKASKDVKQSLRRCPVGYHFMASQEETLKAAQQVGSLGIRNFSS